MADSDLKNDAYWREKLTPEEYQICREKGAERPFAGAYWDCHKPGLYHCRCCDAPLFDARAKYDSGSGWPSFYIPVSAEAVEELRDTSQGRVRTETVCRRCGCHLGHVFPDGPAPTGQRYCTNSASIRLSPLISNRRAVFSSSRHLVVEIYPIRC